MEETISVWAWKASPASLLERALPRRWSHVQGVATRARNLAPAIGADAALGGRQRLHDIGYLEFSSPAPACTASTAPRYLRWTLSTPTRCCAGWSRTSSCAVIEAEAKSRPGRRSAPRVRAAAATRQADALTFCDMTTSPDGQQVHVTHRLAEIHDRYGAGHLVSRSIHRATPLILQAVDQVHARNP